MNGDRGTVTILAAILALTWVFLLVFVVGFGAFITARHRAEGAADLAALAVAAHVEQGPIACERARWVAATMNSRLDECRISGQDARVWVSATAPGTLGFGRITSARAHAGPIDGPNDERSMNGSAHPVDLLIHLQ